MVIFFGKSILILASGFWDTLLASFSSAYLIQLALSSLWFLSHSLGIFSLALIAPAHREHFIGGSSWCWLTGTAYSDWVMRVDWPLIWVNSEFHFFLLPLGPSSRILIGCTRFNFICLQVELLFCHLNWECLVSANQSFLIPYPASGFWLTVICFLSQGICLFWLF